MTPLKIFGGRAPGRQGARRHCLGRSFPVVWEGILAKIFPRTPPANSVVLALCVENVFDLMPS